MKRLRSKTAAAAAAAKGYDCEDLPSFDGSDHYLQLFNFPAGFSIVRGERYYFEQNSRIDGCKITAVVPHYNLQGFMFAGDVDLWRTYDIDGVNCDVIAFADMQNILLTLVSKNTAEQNIERIPAGGFLALPNFPLTPGAAPKIRKAFDLQIDTNKSFIESTATFIVGVGGLVIPISFYYQNK